MSILDGDLPDTIDREIYHQKKMKHLHRMTLACSHSKNPKKDISRPQVTLNFLC
ncbi:hypothetical protein L873DRAFT_1804550 [Choiromyces venosus 120613-1]|uniref:Uncharacterized protein n=1 Tax=Choiromyces venosus 120613-1 TaxID=1336337 RepID=A0A3N4JVD4_9PEZI|nr:hypothetical protein L873DRAFT_1804550 [Choiromyces venosus 120613-1]